MTALAAPPIETRDRIPDETIQELVSRIAKHFRPKRIFLFGSYAYGNPQPESDVDLLIVMDTSLRSAQQAVEIRQQIKPLFGVDILVYTPSLLEERLRLGDSFLQEITARGNVVYESFDA